jgi:hypothetical protein
MDELEFGAADKRKLYSSLQNMFCSNLFFRTRRSAKTLESIIAWDYP